MSTPEARGPEEVEEHGLGSDPFSGGDGTLPYLIRLRERSLRLVPNESDVAAAPQAPAPELILFTAFGALAGAQRQPARAPRPRACAAAPDQRPAPRRGGPLRRAGPRSRTSTPSTSESSGR